MESCEHVRQHFQLTEQQLKTCLCVSVATVDQITWIMIFFFFLTYFQILTCLKSAVAMVT